MQTRARILSRLSASETARVALATELAATRRSLYIERARRTHLIPDSALEFVTATDEEGIERQIALLAKYVMA